MQSVELFTFPIYSMGSEFSEKNLIRRANQTVNELKVKIPCLNQKFFLITFDFKLSNGALGLVLNAVDVQGSLYMNNLAPTLTEFQRRFIQEMKEISMRSNSLVLKEIAGQVFEGSPRTTSTAEDAGLANLRKHQGKLDQFEYDEQRQLDIVPYAMRDKLDERVREIKCVIRKKLRFHAVIDQVRDSFEIKPFQAKQSFNLNLEHFLKDDKFHEHIGPYMRQASIIKLKVKANLDPSTNVVKNYFLVSY